MDIIQTVQDLESDSQSIAKAANEETMVTPRYGDPYKSAPLIIAETEQKAEQALAKVIDNNMMRGFTTEALLKAWVPTYNAYAKAEDTGQIWRYDLAISQWIASGEGDFEKAKKYTDQAIPEFLGLEVQEGRDIYDKSKIVNNFYVNATGVTAGGSGFALYVQQASAGDTFYFYLDNPEGTTIRFALKDSLTPSSTQAGTVVTATLEQGKWYKVVVPSNAITTKAIYFNIVGAAGTNIFDLTESMMIQKDYLDTGDTSGKSIAQIAGYELQDPVARAKIKMLEDATTGVGGKVAGDGADLTAIATFGSSSMAYLEPKLFAEAQQKLGVMTHHKYGASGSRLGYTATTAQANNGTFTFATDNIELTANTVTTDAPYTHTLTHTATVILENGVVGTYKSGTFTPTNLSAALPLPTTKQLKYQSIAYKHRNAVTFLNLGKNDIVDSAANVAKAITATDTALAYFNEYNNGRTLVIGHFANTNMTDVQIQRVNELNAAQRSKHFKYYFDLNAYILSEKVWTDLGLTKTTADVDAIAKGVLPPSLSRDNAHLSEAVDAQIAKLIVQQIMDLGWYS